MRLVRFASGDKIFSGRVDGNDLFPVEGGAFPKEFSLSKVRLLPPSLPSKIVAIGLNYRDHAEELKLKLPEEPLLFIKPPSSVIGPDDEIVLPSQSARVDFEAELAIVIGKMARRVPRNAAREYIMGYTCLNDVTARDLQTKDGQWTRSKSFDTFCPVGPWIETDIDPSDLEIGLYLNGQRKQASRTSNLIFDCFQLVEFISDIMTLMPGDMIATGTTSGIGPMQAGDTVEVRIEGIGSLKNPVVSGVS
jgi:2-keto-4-pentenoate hydratase/2-oxohepta-3-ene-1,7-dioic acid hydratase in catechol pathway